MGSLNTLPDHAKVERLMPALLEEMREDLRNNPTSREFVILKRNWCTTATIGTWFTTSTSMKT
jgi:hypothetical protein